MGMLIYCGMPSRRALATVFNSGPVNNDSNFKIKKTMIGELQEIKKTMIRESQDIKNNDYVSVSFELAHKS